jgi:TolB-like protein/tRNA A-37 threonylcarbamoyl transferase component Bud32
MTDNPQLVFGHFRVAAHPDGSPVELGRGAMGVTYKAFDERLRIDVTLKIIAPAQIDNPKAQASFLREARAAARVHHSNVASVVYLNDTPGNFYYAMEFVEGQPLRDWLHAHPALPPLTIIGVAIQIARGLEAIHEQQLVHRDLKPTNIMMVKASRTGAGPMRDSDPDAWKVKIIDFGLARVVSPEPGAATQTVGFHGTALYASPEQCEERSDIDGRSDLYSLGCILWEMLCGAPPFHARTHRELLNQHVSEPLPMDRLAHAPPSLAAVVARLLIKDPANRFPNAPAVIKALERAREKLESGEEVAEEHAPTTIDPAGFFASESARPPSTAPSRGPLSTTTGSRRDLWIVAAAVLALVIPVLIFVMRGPSSPMRPTTFPLPPGGAPVPTVASRAAKPTQKSIAVLPFANLSSSKENEYFADGVQEDVLTNLTKIRDLRVTSRTSVQRYRSVADRNLRDIGRDLVVGVILEGSVQRSGDQVLVSARLIDAETDQLLWAEKYDRKLTDIFALQSEIAIAIATALRANLAPAERTEVNRPVVANAAALPSYVKARGLMSDLSDDANIAAAITALQDAIAADPNFTLAHAQLSIVMSTSYDWGRGRTPERQALAERSAKTALRLQPDLPEAQLAMAVYNYRVLRDFPAALPYFQRALAALPGNVDVLYESAGMDRRQGKWDSAAEKFEQVAALAPRDPIKQYNAANTYVVMRRYEDAWRLLQPALSRMPDAGALRLLKGQLFLAWKNDLGPAREDMATRPENFPDPANYLCDKIDLMLLEKRFDEALATLRDSGYVALEGQARYVPRASLEAEILTQAGRTAEATAASELASKDLAALLIKNPIDARIRMAYARALAGTGRAPDEAIREARQAAEQVSIATDAMDGPFYQQQLALVYLRTGHPAEAAKIVTRIRKIPSIAYDWEFNLSPAWDALRDHATPTPPTR